MVSVLIFAWAMMRTCFGLAITTFVTCGVRTAATEAALPVASTTTTSSCRSPCAKAVSSSRRMSMRPSRLSLPSSQITASAKARWMSSPMMRMPPSFRAWLVKRELAGNTTPTDPRSRRIRASRRGRPCNELGFSAQGLLAACPHLRAPGAPRPGWAHHKAAPWGEQPDAKGTAGIMPDNGKAERFIQTALREWAYARPYPTSAERAIQLQPWIHAYNWHRPHGSLKGNPPISRLGLPEDNLLRLQGYAIQPSARKSLPG